MAYVADVSDEKNRTQALALFRSGGDLGFVFGGALAGSMSLAYGINAAFGSSLCLFLGAGSLFLIRAIEPSSAKNV